MQNRIEKQIMLFKTRWNWLSKDICYLVICSFDWKISIFQQTVYSILNISGFRKYNSFFIFCDSFCHLARKSWYQNIHNKGKGVFSLAVK